MAVVIGRPCRNIPAHNAFDSIAGYTCANDVSARDFQFSDGQWFRGKSADTFAPLGPWIVTPTQIPDPHRLHIRSLVNDVVMQDWTTAKLIFKVPELIEYISSYMTLLPGDLVLTGTPPGVGFARNPPAYLQPGDRIRWRLLGLGFLKTLLSEAHFYLI